ncbi:MAG: hypothetical protein UCI88_09390 [Megasphaera massiliensis]|uniref:hypothetical protein n=1 Tax=Megasphaera massiliensis TaxID=1232428 RepID=UPI00210DAF5C|nr:hypothetical protein [Megasphaera massiliensis]MCQ5210031.1 hypothetical protein [Megasphaera massiliensis]MEE0659290.1 hypothetical protein [Megasphaera massiliensis]
MKKIFLLLLFFLLTLTVVNADNVRFDNMRTVVIADTTQDNYAARYMKRALIQPFRIPYWDRIESSAILSPSDVTEENLRAISRQYNADVVLVPVVQTWYWRQFMGSYRFRDGGETYTEYRYRLTVYAYDKRTDRMSSYSDSGYDIESTSILNNPDDVLYPAMTRILRKLPYKRIPTDLETTGNTIPGLQTKTTDGGAKILTNTFPQSI